MTKPLHQETCPRHPAATVVCAVAAVVALTFGCARPGVMSSVRYDLCEEACPGPPVLVPLVPPGFKALGTPPPIEPVRPQPRFHPVPTRPVFHPTVEVAPVSAAGPVFDLAPQGTRTPATAPFQLQPVPGPTSGPASGPVPGRASGPVDPAPEPRTSARPRRFPEGGPSPSPLPLTPAENQPSPRRIGSEPTWEARARHAAETEEPAEIGIGSVRFVSSAEN